MQHAEGKVDTEETAKHRQVRPIVLNDPEFLKLQS